VRSGGWWVPTRSTPRCRACWRAISTRSWRACFSFRSATAGLAISRSSSSRGTTWTSLSFNALAGKPFLETAAPVAFVAVRAVLVLYRRVWRVFYSQYEHPLYPVVIRNSYAFVHTTHGLYHGIMFQFDRKRWIDGLVDPIFRFLELGDKLAIGRGMLAIQRSNQDVELGFSGIPLGAYRIQWSSDLTAVNGWNTLSVTNVSDAGGFLQVTDPGSSGQPQRFYRVQTPP
jgi:hypothetical protein